MKRLKKVAKWTAIALGVLVAGLAITGLVLHEGRPEGGQSGEAGDALALHVQQAVGFAAWEQNAQIVAFEFGGRVRHVWDRPRGLAYVTWGDLPGGSGAGTTEVWLRLGDRSGIARVDGEPVQGEEADELLEEGWNKHINDTFWLYPFRSFFDEGVTRKVHGDDLLIEYGSGGATPGDAYLWHLDADGRPTRWEMWVSILPIGGLGASWEGWEDHGGAWFATRHALGPMDLEIRELHVSASAPSPDPFAPLF